MLKLARLLVLLLPAGAVAGAANATTWVATYTGTVQSGIDQTGVFTPVPADLTGQAFTARFVYDPSIGTRTGGANLYDYAYGGATFAAASPILGASLTIAGKTVAFPVGGSEEIYVATNMVEVVSIRDFAGPGSLSGLLQLFVHHEGTPPSIETALSEDATDPLYLSLGNMSIGNQAGTIVAYGNLASTHVTIAPGVPEPAAWVMMLVGLGGLGVMIRRRRSLVAA